MITRSSVMSILLFASVASLSGMALAPAEDEENYSLEKCRNELIMLTGNLLTATLEASVISGVVALPQAMTRVSVGSALMHSVTAATMAGLLGVGPTFVSLCLNVLVISAYSERQRHLANESTRWNNPRTLLIASLISGFVLSMVERLLHSEDLHQNGF